ncbi:AAA family ATPase [Lichenibacterium ramalinae]|uniref:AAA family ATPase n=1 Tax=Lichenibacterium ramalinae TaxID=2316527 RepID=A0A4Q2R8Q0_9HYPH|nr:AAA family ATPase [Lichenibacterium ramalinae]
MVPEGLVTLEPNRHGGWAMASKARPRPETTPPAKLTPHALYGLRDVEAALGRGRRPFQGDPEVSEGSGLDIRHAALEALLEAGEAGRWRTLAHPTAAAVTDVQRLAARAPHMSPVIDLVVRRLRAAQTIGVPTGLPPLLLLGPPGIGKTWLLARLAAALAVPFRAFAMNLATLGDSLTGSHPLWRAGAPGLVAKALLTEAVANPLILVDEIDKPPPHHVGGDLYRPFYGLLEPEGSRSFVDDHLGIPIDASRVMWIAAANDIEGIPAPIVDRLTVVEVGAMAHDDRVAVVRSVYADLNKVYLDFFDPQPGRDLLERLAALPPRRAKLVLDDAMSRAAAEGRRSVEASDALAHAPAPSPTPKTRRMH